MDLSNKWILVTGASSGLGEEIAYQLAKQNRANLILVARRIERLDAVKEKIETTTQSQVQVLKADLADPIQNKNVLDFCKEQAHLFGVILNAGVTYFGKHSEIEDWKSNMIIDLNITSNAFLISELTKHFQSTSTPFKLMVVSSMAANLPLAYQSLYSGSKAFVTNFANALSLEIGNPNFHLSVFSPGGIKTEMTDKKEFKKLEKHLMSVEAVAKEGLVCFHKNKYNHIPGLANKLSNFFMNLLPTKLVAKLVAKNYKKSLLNK